MKRNWRKPRGADIGVQKTQGPESGARHWFMGATRKPHVPCRPVAFRSSRPTVQGLAALLVCVGPHRAAVARNLSPGNRGAAASRAARPATRHPSVARLRSAENEHTACAHTVLS
ncbi:60S ribosomal protein L32-like [Phyllostomus hastatus]|uniref:60S ribosomal protein L32-like n=1 Tax=Phyllostomus hastatus TaxID=9423 RepID=UPI001E682791|nr:60S ribosomal protein L32-like [Phyllostomus hastatus]